MLTPNSAANCFRVFRNFSLCCLICWPVVMGASGDKMAMGGVVGKFEKDRVRAGAVYFLGEFVAQKNTIPGWTAPTNSAFFEKRLSPYPFGVNV
jgi:hypothetical protein